MAKTRINISIDEELLAAREIKDLTESKMLSSLICDLLRHWLSTGRIENNGLISELKEEIKMQNALIERLSYIIEKIYKASAYSANVLYETNDPVVCNKSSERTKEQLMSLISEEENEDVYMLPKNSDKRFTVGPGRSVADSSTSKMIDDRPQRRFGVGSATNQDFETQTQRRPDEMINKVLSKMNDNVQENPSRPEEKSEQNSEVKVAPKKVSLQSLLDLPNPEINESKKYE